MSDGKYPPLTDSLDDLPRTLRREREARERAQREQQAGYPASEAHAGYGPQPAYSGLAPETFPATVVRFDVPFLSLVAFFLKAVLAAVPALLLLIAMLYGLGVVLKTYLPWIVQTEILIRFPK